MSDTTAAPYTANVVTIWATTPVNLLASGAITIDGSAAPIVASMAVGMNPIPLTSNVDSYSDTVTVATAY